MSSLADKLSQELLPEVLEITRSFHSESDRAMALRDLADKLPKHLLSEIWAMTPSVQDQYKRAEALSRLLPRLNLSHWNKEFWQENLHILARQKRQQLMQDLAKFSSVIESLGGLEALRGLATAMRDVCRQWP